MDIFYPFDARTKNLLKQAWSQPTVFIYPTETSLAIGCCIDQKQALGRIYQIKQRQRQKPLLMIVKNWDMVLPWVKPLSNEAIRLFSALDAYPVTIALPSEHQLVNYLNPYGQTLAFRVTSDLCAQEILSIVKAPLVATSANITGQAPGYNHSELPLELKKQINITIDYRRTGKAQPKMPSAVLEYHPPRRLSLKRLGDYPEHKMRAVITKAGWELVV